jgi:hypothetical protein
MRAIALSEVASTGLGLRLKAGELQEQDNIDPKQLELKKKNIPWARLLARVLKIDFETCIKCGGNMKIIAAIEDPKVILKILQHMGLATKPPPLYPARGLP